MWVKGQSWYSNGWGTHFFLIMLSDLLSQDMNWFKKLRMNFFGKASRLSWLVKVARLLDRIASRVVNGLKQEQEYISNGQKRSWTQFWKWIQSHSSDYKTLKRMKIHICESWSRSKLNHSLFCCDFWVSCFDFLVLEKFFNSVITSPPFLFSPEWIPI